MKAVFLDYATMGSDLNIDNMRALLPMKWAALKKMMAPGFQSVHRDGARDRKEEFQLIKGLNFGKYTLTNFKVTQNGPVVIVTYFVSVEETIKGKRLPATKPAARLSAWLKTDSGWKWIIHANLRSLN